MYILLIVVGAGTWPSPNTKARQCTWQWQFTKQESHVNLRKVFLLSSIVETFIGAALDIMGGIVIGVASHLLDLGKGKQISK